MNFTAIRRLLSGLMSKFYLFCCHFRRESQLGLCLGTCLYLFYMYVCVYVCVSESLWRVIKKLCEKYIKLRIPNIYKYLQTNDSCRLKSGKKLEIWDERARTRMLYGNKVWLILIYEFGDKTNQWVYKKCRCFLFSSKRRATKTANSYNNNERCALSSTINNN